MGTDREQGETTMKRLSAIIAAAALALTLLSACGTQPGAGEGSAVSSTVSRMPRTVVSV